ncbi:MAG: hypothetical protein F6K39_30520 [Okeania sp. SIO3B3]|nr:hypothetical protein [Okeania sp. SIO3B3]
MIPAGLTNLRHAFYTHRQEARKISGISANLLLFYAAECGLKSIYLKQDKLLKTDQIQDQTLLSKAGIIEKMCILLEWLLQDKE